MKPGQLVKVKDKYFEIVGIYLGVIGQQNLIGLRCTQGLFGSCGGSAIEEMLVPEELVKLAKIYEEVK